MGRRPATTRRCAWRRGRWSGSWRATATVRGPQLSELQTWRPAPRATGNSSGTAPAIRGEAAHPCGSTLPSLIPGNLRLVKAGLPDFQRGSIWGWATRTRQRPEYQRPGNPGGGAGSGVGSFHGPHLGQTDSSRSNRKSLPAALAGIVPI